MTKYLLIKFKAPLMIDDVVMMKSLLCHYSITCRIMSPYPLSSPGRVVLILLGGDNYGCPGRLMCVAAVSGGPKGLNSNARKQSRIDTRGTGSYMSLQSISPQPFQSEKMQF